MTQPEPDRRVGIREVAARAGVSVSSASRALTGHADVSSRMKERVLAAARELNYEPDELAQGLRTGSTNTVGFVIGDISNPVIAPIVLGAEVALRARGISVVITNSELSPQRDEEHIRLLRRRRVDGLLLSLSDEEYAPTTVAINSVGIPTVLVDRELSMGNTSSAVLIDHRGAVSAAASHLVELGHRRLGLILGRATIRPNRERLRALTEETARSGVQVSVTEGVTSLAEASAATAQMLDASNPPTALIAGSNQLLTGVLRVVRDRGMQVPQDLSLVTCDDVPLLEFVQPPLATIARDLRAVGEWAASLMLERLDGGEPRVVTCPAEFDPRGSCAPPPDHSQSS